MNAPRFRVFAILMSIALLAPAGVTVTAAPPQHASTAAVAPIRASRAGLSKHLLADFTSSLTATTPITPCVQPPSGLVSWWPGDGDANDAWDGNDGTLVGGTTFGTGEVGQAFSFDGVDDYVDIPDAPTLDITGDLTIEAWVQKTAPWLHAHPMIVTKQPINEAYLLWVDSDSVPIEDSDFAVRVNIGGTFYSSRSGVIPAIGTWYHVVGVREGANLKIYVNGALMNTATIPTGGIGITNQSLTIGLPPSGLDLFNGFIDEASLYNRALTDAEIQSIYNAGSAGKCKPPMYVASMRRAYRPAGSGYVITATVTIQDMNGQGVLQAVPTATVRVDMIQPDGSRVVFKPTTDLDGIASLVAGVSQTGTYTFKVKNITKPSWTYDPSLNVEATERITIP